jgi:hypothetical protein
MAFKTLHNQCTLVEGLGQAIKNLTQALCRNIEATMEVMRLTRRQVGGAGQFGGLKPSKADSQRTAIQWSGDNAACKQPSGSLDHVCQVLHVMADCRLSWLAGFAGCQTLASHCLNSRVLACPSTAPPCAAGALPAGW